MKRVFSILLLVMMIFTLFAFPVYATDNGVNAVTVGINPDGTLKVDTGSSETGQEGWTTILTQYRSVIVGVSGVCALTFLLLFILNFTKLGQSAGNPQMRSQALLGLIWTGIACAGCGSVALFVGFFYNLLNTPAGQAAAAAAGSGT